MVAVRILILTRITAVLVNITLVVVEILITISEITGSTTRIIRVKVPSFIPKLPLSQMSYAKN